MLAISYVSHLAAFVEVYVAGLERRDAPWKRKFLDRQEVAVLMSTIDQIYYLNKKFLADLGRDLSGAHRGSFDAHAKDRRASMLSLDGADSVGAEPGEDGEATRPSQTAEELRAIAKTAAEKSLPDPGTMLGPLFANYAPLFKLYGQYAYHHERATEVVDDTLTRPESQPFFDALAAHPRCAGQTIRSYLIMPVQRIPRYKLLVMELLKHTPTWHADGPLLISAKGEIDAAAMHMNAAITQRKQMAELKRVSSQFMGTMDLVRHNRRLVREGPLVKVPFTPTSPGPPSSMAHSHTRSASITGVSAQGQDVLLSSLQRPAAVLGAHHDGLPPASPAGPHKVPGGGH